MKMTMTPKDNVDNNELLKIIMMTTTYKDIVDENKLLKIMMMSMN